MKISGITLIVLVITIIVLLILAGVTIITLTGENGILKRATKAGEETEKQTVTEELKLLITEARLGLLNEKQITNPTIEDVVKWIKDNYDTEIDMTILYRKTANVEIDDSEITDIETGGKNKIEYAEIEYKGYVFILKGDLTIDEGQTSKETTETYTITYNLQGGEDEKDFPSKQIKEGRRIIAREPVKLGNKFKSWNTREDGSGTTYEVGGIFKEKQNTTLYAIWEISEYTITFNYLGGVISTTSKGARYNESYGALPVTTKEGHDFLGWYTLESGGEKIDSSTLYKALGDQTLYAHWKLKQYTVTYDANGGTGAPEEQKKSYGQPLTLSTKVPKKSGNTFLGWAKDQNATIAQYQKGESYTENSDVKLWAIWQTWPVASSVITVANYGESVNYNGNGIIDWRILHKDTSHIYIITSEYLPTSSIPNINGMSKNETYCVGGSINREEFIKVLNNTSLWTMFVNGINGATATATPTVELLIESYNKKHNTSLPTNVRQTIDNSDTLYVPHTSKFNKCDGIFLASPYSVDTEGVWRVNYNGLVFGSDPYYSSNYGLRPVICMPSSVKAIKGSDGKWIFEN